MVTSFDKETHSYLIDGKPATGITTVISVLAKPALIGWASKMCAESVKANWRQGKAYDQVEIDAIVEEAKGAHRKKKEDAGVHGTDTHALVEAYVNLCLANEGKPLQPTATNMSIQQFIDWAQENVDHFLFAERKMYNKDLFIAGTADFAYIGKDGKKYMGDFKTSSGIYGIDYWLQVAGYRLLAESEGDEPYDGSTVVRLGKQGDFEALNRYDYETDKEAFLACLKLYRAQATFKK